MNARALSLSLSLSFVSFEFCVLPRFTLGFFFLHRHRSTLFLRWVCALSLARLLSRSRTLCACVFVCCVRTLCAVCRCVVGMFFTLHNNLLHFVFLLFFFCLLFFFYIAIAFWPCVCVCVLCWVLYMFFILFFVHSLLLTTSKFFSVESLSFPRSFRFAILFQH